MTTPHRARPLVPALPLALLILALLTLALAAPPALAQA